MCLFAFYLFVLFSYIWDKFEFKAYTKIHTNLPQQYHHMEMWCDGANKSIKRVYSKNI